MQDMKEKINQDIEILKNNQVEMNWSFSQIKTSIESWRNREHQVENRILEREDKVEELGQTVNDHEKEKC
jgi:septal ring factor EnvC (AmiA/AmiB activator)